MAPNKTWVSSSRDGASAATSRGVLTSITFWHKWRAWRNTVKIEGDFYQFCEFNRSNFSVDIYSSFSFPRWFGWFFFAWRSGGFGFPTGSGHCEKCWVFSGGTSHTCPLPGLDWFAGPLFLSGAGCYVVLDGMSPEGNANIVHVFVRQYLELSLKQFSIML